MRKLFYIILAALTFAACNDNAPDNNGGNGDNAGNTEINPNSENGAMKGLFSVDYNKYVRFSQGNLQYRATTNTWRFAINQWDTIGSANAQISETNPDYIDLFGWSTGHKPTERSKYAENYDSYFSHEWGKNAISNGGNKPNLWRTMTKEEWGHLCHLRPNAKKRIGLGTVNGVKGLILLPDVWEKPINLDFASFEAMNFKVKTRSDNTDYTKQYEYYYCEPVISLHFGDNPYTLEEWDLMEKAGAIFLPAAGVRTDGTSIQQVNCEGYYWIASRFVDQSIEFDGPAGMKFEHWAMYPVHTEFAQQQYGRAVRLVQDVQESE